MLGLIVGALFGSAAVASSFKQWNENENCKARDQHFLPNGVPYYLDRVGAMRLMDGTLLQKDWGFGYERWIAYNKYGARRVVYDESKERNPELKRLAAKQCRLCYPVMDRYKYGERFPIAMVEFSTDKTIAKIEAKYNYKTGKNEYRKWYWYDPTYERLKNDKQALRVSTLGGASSYDYKSPGKVITKQEFDLLKKDANELGVKDRYGIFKHVRVDVNDMSR